MAEVLLTRILEQRDRIDPDHIPPIFEVLGRGMDVLAKHGSGLYGYSRFLKGDSSSIFGLIQRLDEGSRAAVLTNIFRPGMSYSWLCGIIRESTFEHGVHGDRPKPEEERLLTHDEFVMIRLLYLAMIENTDPADLLNVPYLLDFLYSWLQLGRGNDVHQWITQHSQSDEGLLTLLERMSSSGPTLNGRPHHLKPSDLRQFFKSADDLELRVSRLMDSASEDSDIWSRANKVKKLLEAGREYEMSFPP